MDLPLRFQMEKAMEGAISWSFDEVPSIFSVFPRHIKDERGTVIGLPTTRS